MGILDKILGGKDEKKEKKLYSFYLLSPAEVGRRAAEAKAAAEAQAAAEAKAKLAAAKPEADK